MKPTHEHCLRCGRKLRCATSRARGYGWGCWARMRVARKLAALVQFTRRQVDQAVELIEDAAVVPTAMVTVFRTVSSDGQRIYITTVNACTCPASGLCFHRAGVLMVTA